MRLESIEASEENHNWLKPEQNPPSEATKLLQSTLAMREQLHPREESLAEQVVDFVRRKVKPQVLRTLGLRAGQSMTGINIGEQEKLLFYDDTY